MVMDVGRWKLEGYCGHLGIMQNYSIAFKVSERRKELEIIYYIAAMKKNISNESDSDKNLIGSFFQLSSALYRSSPSDTLELTHISNYKIVIEFFKC